MQNLKNVRIRDIEVYHPDNVMDIECCVNHFKRLGRDTEHYLKDVLGRKKKYVINQNSDENSLTMAVHASKRVLKKTGLTGKDIDLICLATVSPEYNVPPTALCLHKAIEGSDHAMCFDINLNCVGMCYAFELVYKYMCLTEKVNRVLLVGSDYLTYLSDEESAFAYGGFADSACALILEKTKQDSRLIGCNSAVDSEEVVQGKGPYCGYSHLKTAARKDMLNKTQDYKVNTKMALEIMTSLMDECSVGVEDIRMFCFSQVAKKAIKILQNKLGISSEQITFIAEKYGYTGCSSPFIAFYEAVKAGKIHRGDYVFFWTVGFATQQTCFLIKY